MSVDVLVPVRWEVDYGDGWEDCSRDRYDELRTTNYRRRELYELINGEDVIALIEAAKRVQQRQPFASHTCGLDDALKGFA
jgi:hypothetical protein